MSKQERKQTPTDSLAPIVLDRLTIEEETALMNGGKSKQLGAILVLTSICIVGAWTMMGELDTRRAFADAGQATEQASQQYFDGYWHCALPDTHASQIGNEDKLHSQLEIMGERLGKRYGTLLASCQGRLGALTLAIEGISAPGSMLGPLQDLSERVRALDEANTDLVNHLQRTDRYDYVHAAPHFQALAEAWSDYVQARKVVARAANPPS